MNLAIIGGMGPIASANFLTKFYSSKKVENEVEFPNIILFNYTNVPSRTRAYLFNETSPIKRIQEIINQAQSIGCTHFVFTCNSVHFFLAKIKMNGVLFNMIEITKKQIIKSDFQRFAVLGGEVVVENKLYSISTNNKEIIEYDIKLFKKIRSVIDKIKVDDSKGLSLLWESIEQELIIKYKIDCLVLACTELNLIKNLMKTPLIDSIQSTIEFIHEA